MNSMFLAPRTAAACLMLAAFANIQCQGQTLQNGQVTLTAGSNGTWNADWTGEPTSAGHRVYFLQWSLDLQTWYYSPVMEFGPGLKSVGVETEGEPKFFARLKHEDRPEIDDLEQAMMADFDEDKVPNQGEIALLGSDPYLWDTDGDGISDWDEDSDSDDIPDGWEALAVVSLPAGYGVTSLAEITPANAEQIATDAHLSIPPGTLPQQISMVITVPSSAPLTIRPENEWQVPPTDLRFSQTFVGPSDLGSAFPEWHFEAGNALVLVKNSLTEVTVNATCTDSTPVKLKVVRDPADISAVGTGPLTLLPFQPTGTATLSLDGRGSFYLVGWLDSNSDGQLNSAETRYVVPIILVDVNVLSVEHHTVDPLLIEIPGYLGVKFGRNEFDYRAAQVPPWTADRKVPVAEMYALAGLGLDAYAQLIGGKDGMRGTDRVMGGWSNNIVVQNSVGLYRKPNTTDVKEMKISLASNCDQATGWELELEVPQFDPAKPPDDPDSDPAPALYVEPLLDRFELNAGINGMNAICLGTTKFEHVEPMSLGLKIRMMGWDTPKDAWPKQHPNYAGYELRQFNSSTAFSIFLTFWSSPEPFNDVVDGEIVLGRGAAGERTYQTAYNLDWDAIALCTINNIGTLGFGGAITIPTEQEFSPVKEPNTVSHETRPPTSLKSIHIDAR